MTSLLAIDPGPSRTGYCLLQRGAIGQHDWPDNEAMLSYIRSGGCDVPQVILESPQAQDRPLGPYLRNTIFWAGRFAEAILTRGLNLLEVEEPDVRAWLCGSNTANNGALKRELCKRFGDKTEVPCSACSVTGIIPGKRGPRKCPTCNGKKYRVKLGPLASMNEHELSALACCEMVRDKQEFEERKAEREKADKMPAEAKLFS